MYKADATDNRIESTFQNLAMVIPLPVGLHRANCCEEVVHYALRGSGEASMGPVGVVLRFDAPSMCSVLPFITSRVSST